MCRAQHLFVKEREGVGRCAQGGEAGQEFVDGAVDAREQVAGIFGRGGYETLAELDELGGEAPVLLLLLCGGDCRHIEVFRKGLYK